MNDIAISNVTSIEIKESVRRFPESPAAWWVREIVMHRAVGPPLTIVTHSPNESPIPVRLPSGLDI